ncbi:hypothetical protein C8F01DRAFT_1172618 [Mycena amicta]|nr:hypothetical protein C8F01DRAFT_1172618 [Mycena amicta]
MLSFARLATLSVFAVSALAAPVSVQKRDGDLVSSTLGSIPCIIDHLVGELTPVTDALSAITSTESDLLDTVTPLASHLTYLLDGAVADISALAGQPVNDILAAADGTILSVADVAGIVAPVFATVIDALDSVLAVAQATGALHAVEPVLATVGAALCPLLSTTAPLVDGLLAAAAPLLIPVLGTADTLGLAPVVSLVEGVAGVARII